MFGINVRDWNLKIQADSVKQPIKSNSAGSWHMSHWWTHAFEYHLNHGFIVLKNVQHSIGQKISHSKAHCQRETKSELSCVGRALAWFLVRLHDVVRCIKSSCANESLVLLDWLSD